MEEALAYLPAVALFSFVIVASALLRHDLLILATIPPVFVAMVVGFMMAVYSDDTFGTLPVAAALVLGAPPAWFIARRLKARDLLLVIYLAWSVAMVLALVAFGFPDHT